MGLLKVVLLTSTSLRHKYMAHKISQLLDLSLIITEEKSTKITATAQYNEEDAQLGKQHFALRDESEAVFFGEYQDFPDRVEHLEFSFK